MVLLLLLLALLALGGYWALVFYAAMLAVGVAWLMTYPSLARLRLERFVSDREVEIGERVTVRVRILNAGALPVAWLLLEDLVTPAIDTSSARGELTWLSPGCEVKIEYQILCSRRGYYRVGPLFAEAGDYFGLLRRFLAKPPIHYLTVRPRPLPIGALLVPTSRPVGEVRAPFALLDDPTRPAGVREYRRGDPLRRIHWKATAHTGRLHSRVYEPAVIQGASIVLDFHTASWPEGRSGDSELAVTTAASIATHLRDRNQQFALVSNGLDGARMIEDWPCELDVSSREQAAEVLRRREPPERFEPVTVAPGRSAETLDLVLGALARLHPGTGLTLEEMIAREHPAWPRELAALLIVPELRESLMESIGILRGARFPVAVIVVGGEAVASQVGNLRDAGVTLYHVPSEEAIALLAL